MVGVTCPLETYHTVDVFEDKSVLDFYVDKFSFFAWYRRIVPYVLRRVKSKS